MLKIKDETFVDIKEFDGRYMIGNKGTVIGISRSKDNRYKEKQWILKQYEDRNGYMYVTLQKDKKKKTIKVHRLVAQHFINNINNYPCVNHIDSNRKNNNVQNLECVTYKQNMEHAVKNHRFDNMAKINREKMKKNKIYLISDGYKKANKKTSKKVGQYDKNNNLIKIYKSISEASRQTKINITSISYSANNLRKTGGGYIWHFI